MKSVKKEGVVLELLPNALFRIKLDDGKEILAYPAGRVRKGRIRILPGDKVIVELSPYDQKRGRVIWRK